MRWMIQSVSLLVMLILGIFLGIDSAEKNMQKLQGTEGAPRAIQVTPMDGKVQIQVLGKDVIPNQNNHLFEDQTSTSTTIPTSESESVNKATQAPTLPESKVDVVTSNGSSSTLAQFGNDLGSGLKITTRKILDLMFGWANSDDSNPSNQKIDQSDLDTTSP